MIWENIYTDLVSTEHGEHTGYVELFESENVPGHFHWEVLKGTDLVTMGDCVSVEDAKKIAEQRLTILEGSK